MLAITCSTYLWHNAHPLFNFNWKISPNICKPRIYVNTRHCMSRLLQWWCWWSIWIMLFFYMGVFVYAWWWYAISPEHVRLLCSCLCSTSLSTQFSVFSVFGLLWNDTQCHVNWRLFNTRFRQEDDVDDHDDNNESQPRINITTTSTTNIAFSALVVVCAALA